MQYGSKLLAAIMMYYLNSWTIIFIFQSEGVGASYVLSAHNDQRNVNSWWALVRHILNSANQSTILISQTFFIFSTLRCLSLQCITSPSLCHMSYKHSPETLVILLYKSAGCTVNFHIKLTHKACYLGKEFRPGKSKDPIKRGTVNRNFIVLWSS